MIVAMVLLLGKQYAAAQEVRPFAITDLNGQLELRVRDDWESRTRPEVGSSWESSELQIREGIGVDIDAYIYHPRLIKLSVGALLESLQDQSTDSLREEQSRVYTRQNTTSNSFPVSGDFNITVLEQHDDTLTLHGSRKELDVQQPFARSFALQSNTFGGNLSVHNWKWPIDLSFSHSTQQGSGAGADINETEDVVSLRLHYEFGEKSSGDAEASMTSMQDLFTTRVFDSTQFVLDNTTFLDKDNKVRLYGNLRATEQSGAVNLTSLSFRESLDWRHTNHLQSRYFLTYDETQFQEENMQVWGVGASLSHSLYESLQTNIDAYARLEEATYGTTTTYGITAKENYTKRLGSWGRLSLSVQGQEELLENQRTQTSALVRGESHVVNPGEPIFLGHTNVEIASIVVMDERGVRVYSAISDYTVLTIGDPPQIRPEPLGDILEGSTITIDYRYKPPGNGSVMSVGGSTDVRLSVGQLFSLYARHGRTEQTQIKGIADTRLESLQQNTYGATATWRFLTVGAEYDRRESILSPSETTAEWISVSGKLINRLRGQITLTRRDSTFGDIVLRSLKSQELNGTLYAEVSQRGRLSLETEYRNQVGNAVQNGDDLKGYGIRLGYEWRYRKISVEAKARISNVEQRGQIEDQNRFELLIRREF